MGQGQIHRVRPQLIEWWNGLEGLNGLLLFLCSILSNLPTLTCPLPHPDLTLPLYTPAPSTPSRCCPVFSCPNCTPPPVFSYPSRSLCHSLSPFFLTTPFCSLPTPLPSLSLHALITFLSLSPTPHSPLPLTNFSPLFLTLHTLSPPHPLSLYH